MAKNLTALLAGLIFGLGLALSGMINPNKVLGFLDIFGQWDPSLLFVMAGGLVVAFIGFRWVLKARKPLFAESFPQPPIAIDPPLIVGAVLFGIGWGLAGYCPGPAIAALALGGPKTVIFVAAMLIGMAGFNWAQKAFGQE